MPVTDSPINTAIEIDWRVAAFAMGAALVTAFLCGGLPALRSVRLELVPAFEERRRGRCAGCICATSMSRCRWRSR